ncbi:MAG: glucose-1-phosphate adenylyltransferase subunit GlgD [Chloroflexota bacterium]
MANILSVILAGGQGERLSVLSQERAKPAVPFAGKYRIIDFALSNCVNSGIHNIVVLTQYQPLSLAQHIGIGLPWGLGPSDRGVRLLQPYLAREQRRDWYRGTADAVFQNMDHIEADDAELILMLSGDHVYKMDYSAMIKFHEEHQADVTLAVTRFAEEELHRFGTVIADESGRVTGFQEKVKQPKSNLVSMGIYVFNKDILRQWLTGDAKTDFGRHIFPRMVGKAGIFAYVFDGYWRDIGTVESYWQANMELLEMFPDFLAEAGWPIRTSEIDRPPAIISENARVMGSMVANGCVIEGCVEHSVLSPGVKVARGATVRKSVIMDDSTVGSDSIIDRSILDKGVVVKENCYVGFGDDLQPNRKTPRVLNTGITIIGKRAEIPAGARIGRNCIIYSNVTASEFSTLEIPSGETIRSRRRRSS